MASTNEWWIATDWHDEHESDADNCFVFEGRPTWCDGTFKGMHNANLISLSAYLGVPDDDVPPPGKMQQINIAITFVNGHVNGSSNEF